MRRSMIRGSVAAFVFCLGVLAAPQPARALTASIPNCLCSYTVPNLYTSGDNWYSGLTGWGGGNGTWCSVQQSIASSYGITTPLNQFGWGPGYGTFECDSTKPFGRTMNAITALATASPNTITGTLFQFQTAAFPLLDWAYIWTANKMDNTVGKCEHGDMIGFNAAEGQGKVKLYVRRSGSCKMGFFHGLDAAERAGTLVHESRHVGGPGHYNQNQDFSFGEGGAYAFEVTWLTQYADGGTATPPLLRCSAADRAKSLLNMNFVIPPPGYQSPDFCD